MDFTKVAIVGGTHGNESTGVFLVKKLKEQFPEYRGITLDYCIGNPKAVKECRRFIDSDLNRAFTLKELTDEDRYEYESNRAKVINQMLGPKGKSSYDFIIDMHTTTTNMGTTVILCELNEFNLQMAAYLSLRLDDVYIYYIPSEAYLQSADHAFLNSIHPRSLSLELGPIPNGILRHDVIAKTEEAVMGALDFLSEKNETKKCGAGGSAEAGGVGLRELPEEIEVYEHLRKVEFPIDLEGEISACIHRDLQDRDYQPLTQGDAIFQTIDNTTNYFEGDDNISAPLYPVFINEAAYYRNNTAFSLTQKKSVAVPTSRDS